VTLTASGKKEKKNILKEVRRKIYAAHQIYYCLNLCPNKTGQKPVNSADNPERAVHKQSKAEDHFLPSTEMSKEPFYKRQEPSFHAINEDAIAACTV
jgi:hypothetical protein